MGLPFDIARCKGEERSPFCQKCRRREPGHPTHQWHVFPVVTEDGCENFISNDLGGLANEDRDQRASYSR